MSFKLSTKEVVGVAIGAALFGVLMVYGGITVFTNTKLSSAYVIPVIIGALFGPIPAALVGLIGNFFADFLGGWGYCCLLYTSPSPRDRQKSRMPSSA